MPRYSSFKNIAPLLGLSLVSCFGFTTVATAQSAVAPKVAAAQVQTVINNGNQKIDSRLTAVSQLQTKVDSMTKLSDANKQELRTELATTTSKLNAQRTKLDADTTLAAAKADYADIFKGIRVYALVIPKVTILKVADDQLNKDDAGLFYASLLKLAVAGNPQTANQSSKVDDMITKIVAAKKQSQTIHDSILSLQPSDYNADHTLLKGKLASLKQARASYKDAIKEGDQVLKAVQAN